MSTIGNGVWGIVQGQTSAKGAAGQASGGGRAEEGAFSSAIASLQGRGEEHGRKGGRISISAGAGAEEQDGEASGNARVKIGHRDVAALAEALRKAAGGDAGDSDTSFEEKAAALLEAAERHGRKLHAEAKDAKAAEEAGDAAPEGADGGSATAADMSNILELLAAQPSSAHAVAAGANARSSGNGLDGKLDQGGKPNAKTEIHANAAASTDAADAEGAAEAGDLPQSETDRVFRLIRADGKGRDLDMSLSGNGDRAAFRDANLTGPKGEAVTVVDARRYIGLAQTGNAAAVTTAIAQDPEWTASLSATGNLTHAEAAATGKVVNTLKIQMHPIELGLVTATLRLQGDGLVVSLQVQTGEAYRQLTDDKETIIRALRGHGFTVDQVSVQLAPSDRSANAQGDTQQQQQQQQFSNQPQAREGGSGRQGGGDGSGTFAREGAPYDGNTSENASGLAGGQPVRSVGVYL